MFLHLGGNVVVSKREVVAIINLDTTRQSSTTTQFLNLAKDENVLKTVSLPGKEKSFVVTTNQVYLSPISASTLARRSGSWKDSGDSDIE